GIAVTADSVYVQNNVSDSLGTINVTASSSVAARTYVQNNVLKANTFTGQPAIFVGNTGGGMISGNRIEQSAGIGIQVNGATNPTLATPLIISNNFVHSKNTNFGLAISGTNNVYVLHNSVHVTGSTSSTGLYVSGGSNNTVLNNNVSNSGGGIAVTLSNVSAIKDLNNNNYYTTGANLGNYNNTNRATLALWQSATGKEGASKNVTPGFLSTTDLHTSQTALDSAGTIAQYNPGSGYQQIVVADFDGEVRNVVKPDIGADEISLIAIDGGVVVITEPTGAALQPASPTKAVKIRIKNFGAQALTSATVNWTVNGVAQTPYSFSGNVASQDTSAVLSIGTINFATGRSYTVQAWTSSVNGSPDNNPVNDSAIVRNVWPALCGSYTVGGSNPDFVTLRDAVNELKNGGLLCAVTINIRNGLYADSTYVLTALPGSSAANTATIRSESGDSSTVVLQTINALPAGVNSLPMFVFDKAQNITVQGLTLRYATNPGIAPEAFVLFRNNGNRNITLANNVLENRSSQTLGLGISSGTGNGSIDTAIVIRNNWLRKVGGIQFCSDADNSSIFNTLLNMPGMRIEGNRIDSVSGGMGISVKNALGPVVSGNRLPQSVIWVRHSSSPQIIANTVAIGNEFSPGYTINTGIALNNITSTAAAHTLIANNMVSVADLSVANTNVPTGIGANGVDYLDLYFNNILLRHTDNQGYIFWGGGAHVNLKNNIFASTSGNPALSGNTFESSDYNNFYTTGNIAPGVATLNDWTGLTIFDDHSLSVNPFFTSNTDLHVAASELDGAGLAITGISTDVDGELRNDPPDMGADERAALARDAALTQLVAPQQPYTHGLQPVKVLLKNNGSQTLTSAQIAWTIAGVAQPVYNWTGSIAPSATATVTIGNYDFQLRSDNRLRAIVSNPNGGADEFNANDTLTQNNLWAALNGSYTIGGITPTFTDFLQAFEQLQKGGVTGSVSIAARNGTYAGSFYVSNIPGHGVANPITIWGETHNRDSVSITGPHTGFSHSIIVPMQAAVPLALSFARVSTRTT
ncbi:MAG: right-handed parallel beta-helix repeat-containing protein, partial [Chitinophagaceae bacterium]